MFVPSWHGWRLHHVWHLRSHNVCRVEQTLARAAHLHWQGKAHVPPARDAGDRARVRMYSRCNESLCSMWQTPGSLVSAAIVAACALRSDEAAMIKRCVTDSNGLEGDGETR